MVKRTEYGHKVKGQTKGLLTRFLKVKNQIQRKTTYISKFSILD